jgi:transcriptional regulator with XRE-family HTH domain
MKAGLTQRQLAAAAGVAQSTVARIESGSVQPTLPMLYRLLAAADLEPRIRLETYDSHDDVLDELAGRYPDQRERAEVARDVTLAALATAK